MFNVLLVSNSGLIFESIVLAIIACAQVYFAFDIWRETEYFRSIFSEISNVNKIEQDDTLYVSYTGENKIMTTIILTINNYLDKNKNGIIDFHILKDIVDRNVDNIEDEINNKISAPLYLGLAGTMIGIVIGLYSLGNDSDLENTIQPLLTGIKYAMSVSVLGLIITTALSVIVLRRAKSQVNEGKNEFLSLLQTDLLPSLIKSEQAYVQELSNRLQHFSVNTPNYIKSLDENTKSITSSIKNELGILKEIKQLDIKKMSSANVEIFYALSEMMESFESFPKYYKELNASLGNTIKLNKNLDNLVSSTNDVSFILGQVKDIVESGNEATTFFNAHIQSFEKYSDSVNSAVASADQKMETAILQLGEAVSKQFEEFSKAVVLYDSKLSMAFDNSIKQFNKVYLESTPKFENLEHLNSINLKLDDLTKIPKKLDVFQKILEDQNTILSDFNITLPKDLNLNINNKKGIYFYFKEGLIVLASVGLLTSATIYLISFFTAT